MGYSNTFTTLAWGTMTAGDQVERQLVATERGPHDGTDKALGAPEQPVPKLNMTRTPLRADTPGCSMAT